MNSVLVAENGGSFGGVATEEPAADQRRYTIDELAATTGVPSRTIRFYQASGALSPPRREGRIAYYDDQHVERLRLVAELQNRGLSLKAIRDLVDRMDSGDVSVSEWLGIGDELESAFVGIIARASSGSASSASSWALRHARA